MGAHAPRVTEDEEDGMVLRMMFGTMIALSVTAGGIATWTAGQTVNNGIIDRNTLVPVSVAIVAIVLAIRLTMKLTRYLDGREPMERDMKRVLTLLLGEEDMTTGIREFDRGLVGQVRKNNNQLKEMSSKLDRVLNHMEREE